MGLRLASPARLIALFVLLSGVPLIALGWLGWRLLEQDRALDAQRLRDRLENGAGALTRELERELAAWETLLERAADPRAAEPPAGTSLLIFTAEGVVEQRGARLPYLPRIAADPAPASNVFAEAEVDEFQRADLRAAAAAYARLADVSSPPIRAAALMRLARVLRKQQRHQEALNAYSALAMLGDVTVAGSPSELVARRERMVLFETMSSRDARIKEAEKLSAALVEGRFAIDRPTFDFYWEATGDTKPSTMNTRLGFAEAMDALWPELQNRPGGRADWSGEHGAFICVWRRAGSRGAAVVTDVASLATRIPAHAQLSQVRWSLENAAGQEIFGHLPARDVAFRKTFLESGLPWTIRMAAGDGRVERAFVSRRNLFAASLGLMVLVIAASSYFVFRAVNRELRVARLQSDFVAAVSHEFRTPLTAMCHLTELLEEGEAPPGRIAQYHRVLARESRRLHAMVENLLDFGRVEAGRRTYELADIDANSLVADIVRDFREQRADEGARVRLTEPAGSSAVPLMIRVDRSAMAVVMRNLLDNAIKYSPAVGSVLVSVRPEGAFVGISVDDEGPGISTAESHEIFRKFTRGAAARTMNVKGTGIGLTLAAEIVRAHGGRIEVDSGTGRGSRFTTFLPLQASPS